MSDKTIIRVPKNNNYSIISNIYANDDRLSWKAKGILTYLLSKPDDWQVYAEHLKTVSKDGIKSVYSGLRELMEYGYMERHAFRDEKKRIIRWEYLVIESPQNNCKKESESPVSPENTLLNQNRQVGFRQEEKKKIENGGLLNTDINQKQKTATTDSKEKTESLSLSPDNAIPESQAAKKTVNTETQSLSLSPEFKTEHDTLVGLIPKAMQKPVIINLVDKYHRSHGFEHVADCIVYTNQRPQREGNGTLQAEVICQKDLPGSTRESAVYMNLFLIKKKKKKNLPKFRNSRQSSVNVKKNFLSVTIKNIR